jgi:3-deoxy-manno-octulosonate cytidylyltransferase (CMP-KDO synthetase)
MSRVPFRVVIPARYASTRLPAKALRDVHGRPLVLRVLDRAREAGALEVLVATDDARIADLVKREGAEVVMTSAAHASGTDRLAEVAKIRRLADDAIVVNLQGDEPLIDAKLLGGLAEALDRNPIAGIATCATPIHEPEELFRTSIVKTVLDARGFALYFSRAPIPFVRDAFSLGTVPKSLPSGVPFLRHLGLYAYRARTLLDIATAPIDTLETAECLEQLRAMHLGHRIHVTVLDSAPPHGVDTEDDLERVCALFAAREGGPVA